MRTFRLYNDQGQQTWQASMKPGEYVLFCSEAGSAAPLDLEGRPVDASTATAAAFEALDAAAGLARSLVERFPTMQCQIFDHEGRVNPPVLRINRQRPDGLPPRRHPRLLFLGTTMFLLGCGLMAYDWHYDFGKLFPAFIGASLITVGFRMWIGAAGNYDVERMARRRFQRLTGQGHGNRS